jgi:CRISPR-associated protein Cmr6
MENGKLKIKSNGKVELKVNGKEQANIKRFDFGKWLSNPNTYDCQVEMVDGKPVNIVVNGQIVPKNEQIIQQREEDRKLREAEVAKQKEIERLAQDEARKAHAAKQNPQQPSFSKAMDSYDLNKACVPKDTRRYGDATDIDNFALKFYQFAQFEVNDKDVSKSKFQFFKTDRGKIVYNIAPNFGNIDFKNLSERAFNHAKLLLNEQVEMALFKPDWRLVIGLGSASVYETGMTLHHVYGFPYIPSSSIKGIIRHFVISECYENNEGKAIENELFCQIFGCPANVVVKKDSKDKSYKSFYGEARAGKLIFFDALPTQIPKLKPDIMNVHYPDWYGNKKDAYGNTIPPTDTQSPNPILFLTVEDTPFQFLFGSKKIVDIQTKQLWKDKTLAEWLRAALTEHGIGAKTAVGYGYMKS